MDLAAAPVSGHELVPGQHAGGEKFHLGTGQSVYGGLGPGRHLRVGQSGGEGVPGHQRAEELGGVGTLDLGVDHGASAPQQVQLAKKDVGLPKVQGAADIGAVKEGEVDGGGVVGDGTAHHLPPAGNAREGGGLGKVSLDAHVDPDGGGGDGVEDGAVLVAAGIKGQKIPQAGETQLVESLLLHRPYAGKGGKGSVVRQRHGSALLFRLGRLGGRLFAVAFLAVAFLAAAFFAGAGLASARASR